MWVLFSVKWILINFYLIKQRSRIFKQKVSTCSIGIYIFFRKKCGCTVTASLFIQMLKWLHFFRSCPVSYKSGSPIPHIRSDIVSWHLLGHAIKSVTCFDLQFSHSTRPMTSFCIFIAYINTEGIVFNGIKQSLELRKWGSHWSMYNFNYEYMAFLYVVHVYMFCNVVKTFLRLLFIWHCRKKWISSSSTLQV
jgi:hypothetical protein